MATTTQAVTQAIQHGELKAFALGMPRLAPDWSPKGASSPGFTADDASMTLTASANWAAPLDAAFLAVDPAANTLMPVTLVKADGTVESGKGVILTLFAQSWIRLGRLYTQVLETSSTSRPEFARGLPVRPVPRYVFYPGQTATIAAGIAEAWADLGFAGEARFYDADGLPIDPVAVMAAFAAILTKFPVLQAVELNDPPLTPLPLAGYLGTLAPSAKTRLRFAGPDGRPYGGAHLQNATAVASGSAIYELSGTSVTLEAAGSSFKQEDRDRLVLGPGTSGRLTDTFTPPTLPSGVTVARDFYSLRVVALDPYLVGTWPSATDDPAAGLQRRPAVRVNENATLLADGNDVLGAIGAALTGAAAASLAVAQAIDGTFAIPSTTGTAAHWPQFPPGVPVDATATLGVALKTQLALTANWVTTTATSFAKADVVLKLEHLPDNAWVRIYPRKFLPDARLARGDGAGALVPAGGTVTIALADPFSLRDPRDPDPNDVHVPTVATLMFDLVVVLPNGASRIFGGLSVDVGPAPATPPTSSATNAAGTAQFRGVSNAGILGLGLPGTATPPASLADWAKLLSGETQPRDASRLPTMARRELLVAGSNAGTWTGVVAGGRIAPEALSGQSRIGAPGSTGGRETSVTGVTTKGGILAYDIARHAFRRSKDVISRCIALANDDPWKVPAQPTAVPVGGTAGANNGTFAGAVLQTIAPFCETPELYAAWGLGINVNTALDYVVNHFIPQSLPLRQQVVNALNDLKTTPAAPAPASETSAEQRIAVELEREVTSVFFGRRDAQWALKSAIASARHLIYIETPGFCSTAAASNAPKYAADIVDLLKKQLTDRPGLRLVICVPKVPDFAPGYEGMLTYEVADRLTIVRGKTAPPPVITPLPPSQTVLFHPIGFPGRFARVETNVVIVDDNWLLAGGASIRRRGLTFDGSSDLVLTDTLLENGRSPAIAEFRRTLMAHRLGLPLDSTHSSFVGLTEPQTAFRTVKDVLDADGLGDVTPVWDGVEPGVTLATVLPIEQSNPEGRDFDFATAVVVAALAGASGL